MQKARITMKEENKNIQSGSQLSISLAQYWLKPIAGLSRIVKPCTCWQVSTLTVPIHHDLSATITCCLQTHAQTRYSASISIIRHLQIFLFNLFLSIVLELLFHPSFRTAYWVTCWT